MNGYETSRSNDHALTEHLKEVSTETRQLAETVAHLIEDVEKTARRSLAEQPLATVAMAVGVGYVLGGGLPTRLTALLVGVGSRLAFQLAAQRVLDRLSGRATSA